MKNFLTSLLGALVALLIFSVAALLLVVGIVGAIISAGVHRAQPAAAKVPDGSYLVFDLSTNITDAPPPYDFGELGPVGRNQPLQLRSVLRAIRAADEDSRIKGILLTGSLQPSALGTGYASLQELRSALLKFRKDKPIRAYLDFATTRDYYLASTASEVTLNPYGLIYMPGLAVEPMFYAGTFQKYGIDVQVTRVGKYKSYVEPYIRRDMSPENREETQRLLDDVWGSILSDIGHVRQIRVPDIQAVVDAQGLIRSDAAKRAHLVDSVEYRDQLIDELRKVTGTLTDSHTFMQVNLNDYIRQEVTDSPGRLSGPGVAIVYAEGDIVDGEGDTGEIGGDRFSRELRKLRQDDNVKAVVLRVNSPGGSATAAEQIQREVVLTRKVKPVIVSMGSYAASGGYWISVYGQRIFADPSTITGSIGVFGIQFDVEKLAASVGLSFDRVKTGKFADALTITRAKTPEELAILQGMVDWIYGQFIHKVAEGRHLDPVTQVEPIAQGRVWSGIEARRLGLVDEIGDLPTAVRYAVKQAKLAPGYRIMEYPQKKTLQDALADLFGRVIPEAGDSKAGVIGQIEKAFEHQLAELRSFNDPQGIYARLPLDLSIK